MFTVEQRDALQAHVLHLAEGDARVTAAALVGSLAVDAGDRFSDLDMTFGVADEVGTVLDDWTASLAAELDAVALVDLDRDSTTYRVFLLPDALQFDLSMTPADVFRPAGPRFRLLFGEIVKPEPETGTTPVGDLFISTPAIPEEILGWGVIYALHARACIERGRAWQAAHYTGAARDHALALACLREGQTPFQARGYDDLSPETLAALEGSRDGSLERDAQRTALAATVRALLREASTADLPHAATIADRLSELRDT